MKNIKQRLAEEIECAENLQQFYLEAGPAYKADADRLQCKLAAARQAQADNDLRGMVDAWRKLRNPGDSTS